MTQNLDIGGVISRTFSLYGQQAGVLLPAAAIVFLPIAILQAILLGLTATIATSLLSAITALLLLIGIYWYQGVVVEAVADMQDGRRDFSVGQLFGAAGPYVPRLIGAGLLVALVIFGSLIVLVLLAIAVPPLFILLLAWIALAIVLEVWWSVTAPAIVVERTSVTGGLGRSRGLVRGSFWHVLLVLLVMAVILFVLQTVLGLIFGGGDPNPGVLPAVGTLIAAILGAPLLGIAAAVIFFELRALKGGAAAAGAPPAEPAPPPSAPPPPPPASAPPTG